MIKLTVFGPTDFDKFISWIDSEDLLITIAGTVFSFPLTREQLQKYLEDEKSLSFNIVDPVDDNVIGHAEIVLSGEKMYKIDKLIIGDKSKRGKGTGQLVINALLDHAFAQLNAEIVELNVFDWNIAGIKCYEKCGFIMNPAKQATFRSGEETWTALNMLVKKEDWLNKVNR
jgi:RimJ/RimL family protein N-acetyltransferase